METGVSDRWLFLGACGSDSDPSHSFRPSVF